ncbi:DUF3667 domain-containing protein [uncultured Tenacibaculum sp.]|uniref:DUF3667 domain-containing protein n=1 Tax=uncultured Tenacibaculum sp. TaxID=174713 RepID=UPI00261BE1DB|nr:DUF3667 domain-containing protein [uncultured Tenacibaculum sp.]
MGKKNKVAIIKDPNCLNCGHPFIQDEKFCPECGQKNKGKKITLISFIREVFAGFISWDAKFWKTLIPLLIRPGKVSRDYIDGKRTRYVNPFRFYITTSIIFFLIFSLISSYNKFQDFSKGNIKKNTSLMANIPKDINIDSLKIETNKQLEKIPLDSVTKKTIIDEVNKQANDTTNNKIPGNISFGGSSRLDQFISFNRKNPDVETDIALDSLKYEKTFLNRFFYSRAEVANSFVDKKEKRDQFLKQMLSYGSISLFILLPIFTFFLKIFYIRGTFTYVEHLIFVFHTQTVFFLLITLFIILDFFTKGAQEGIFVLLFLLYLFIAMKSFYKQGYFKTFIKFSLINLVYLFLATIGVVVVGAASFAFL